eukprot:TRINITY_DN25055_c0_g1_i1.p1 TRINITY_DN25055_c0_g1~~TRINITY_DN25055_c0_g1_i1.p1  ORF type:complete len:239 (+),score=69.50 TRINITY_DN25055_c0_g1_i1:76-792(+)
MQGSRYLAECLWRAEVAVRDAVRVNSKGIEELDETKISYDVLFEEDVEEDLSRRMLRVMERTMRRLHRQGREKEEKRKLEKEQEEKRQVKLWEENEVKRLKGSYKRLASLKPALLSHNVTPIQPRAEEDISWLASSRCLQRKKDTKLFKDAFSSYTATNTLKPFDFIDTKGLYFACKATTEKKARYEASRKRLVEYKQKCELLAQDQAEQDELDSIKARYSRVAAYKMHTYQCAEDGW